MNIQLTLLALTGTLLLSAEAIADPGKQDSTAKQVTAPEPTTPAPAAPGSTAKRVKGLPYYAKVGSMYVTWIDYNYEYSNTASKKFYHSKPSEDLVAVFQREIGDTLVTNAMLVLEAKRRKLKPDAAVVKQQLDQFEQRFAKDPKWPEARARVLPVITVRFQNESLRSKLEKLVRSVPPPGVKQLRQYYTAHPEKFTSPPQPRVSVLLLRMDPAAPESDWQKAAEQAQDLVKRLRAGEDFAEMARQYSGDKTAEDGGDMGYLHEGMLPGLPAEIVSKLQPGETSDPVNLLEGVAIFRLTDRMPAKVISFEAAKERATDLLTKEQSESAWNSLVAKLKKNTPVQVDESRFLPLPANAGKLPESMDTGKP